MPQIEHHYINRSNWLRAAVMGANDGIVSTTSLLVGIASAGASSSALLITGIAATVAGALSMAAGEYVSVSSQADTEQADLAREKFALANHHSQELDELAGIYRERGLEPDLAHRVARQLMAHDALEAHARDELGISHITDTNPLQAAWSSALSFAVGSLLPLLTVWLAPAALVLWLCLASLVALALLGYLAAKSGGANPIRSLLRILFWGSLAMAVTAGIGSLFDITI